MEPALALCLAAGLALQLSPIQQKNICEYEKAIIANAQRYDVEPELVTAVMYVESAFYPNVKSSAGACGLMQVIPRYTGGIATGYKKYTCQQLKRPSIGIKTGTRVLNWTIHHFAKGNIDKGLCFYNAGYRCSKRSYYKKLYYVKLVKEVRDKIKRVYEEVP